MFATRSDREIGGGIRDLPPNELGQSGWKLLVCSGYRPHHRNGICGGPSDDLIAGAAGANARNLKNSVKFFRHMDRIFMV